MAQPLPEVVIPDRAVFKAAEVCELLKVQPYVLRSWENEFKDLGVAKTPGAPRTYRRADVERALRIRQLVFADGLTLAGVRRRLEAEKPPDAEEEEPSLPADEAMPGGGRLSSEARARIAKARDELRGLLAKMSGGTVEPSGARAAAPTSLSAPPHEEFHLEAPDLQPLAAAADVATPVDASEAKRKGRRRRGSA